MFCLETVKACQLDEQFIFISIRWTGVVAFKNPKEQIKPKRKESRDVFQINQNQTVKLQHSCYCSPSLLRKLKQALRQLSVRFGSKGENRKIIRKSQKPF
ncbi:hypothetical protein ATANTOWER_013511 [Ataeniobius toweri]|uniref:Uncharacterized protein n=1 Tax=Ataeniobius toweri TaxID=208326 RepID=A0ABU7CH94_9TELE|nr:hypothetical protein [Ataeniobius toweri]